MYLWCVYLVFTVFILWLLCQKWQNKRAYIYTEKIFVVISDSSRNYKYPSLAIPLNKCIKHMQMHTEVFRYHKTCNLLWEDLKWQFLTAILICISYLLIHRGRVTHISVRNLSQNWFKKGLPLVRPKPLYGLMTAYSIGRFWANFSGIWIKTIFMPRNDFKEVISNVMTIFRLSYINFFYFLYISWMDR